MSKIPVLMDRGGSQSMPSGMRPPIHRAELVDAVRAELEKREFSVRRPSPLYDGLIAEQCLLDWLSCRQIAEGGRVPLRVMTPTQIAAAKELWASGDGAHWSAQIRAKVTAARERERLTVCVQDQDEP